MTRTVKLMIVDDSDDMRQAIAAAAKKIPGLNIQVVAEASDGLQAVQTISARAPDLVALDLNMPRMDGFEAAAKLSAKVKGLRILVISAATDHTSMMRSFNAGAHAFLAKPFTQQDFQEKVLAVLED